MTTTRFWRRWSAGGNSTNLYPRAADGMEHIVQTFGVDTLPGDTVLRTLLDIRVGISIPQGQPNMPEPGWWQGYAPTFAVAVTSGDVPDWPFPTEVPNPDPDIIATGQLEPSIVSVYAADQPLEVCYSVHTMIDSKGQRKAADPTKQPVVVVPLLHYGDALVFQPDQWGLFYHSYAYLRVLFERTT